VVSTPLKNMKVSWEYYSQYMEKKKPLPNHQPVFIFPNLFPSISSTNPNFSTDSTVHLPALAAVSGDTEEARLMELVAVGGLIWQDEPAVEKG